MSIKFGADIYAPEEVNELARASIGYIESDVMDIKKRYVTLGFHLYEMDQCRYYEDLGYENLYECIEANFAMDKSAVSRCIGVWKAFAAVDGDGSRKMWIDDRYKDFSYSQLTEMLPMSERDRYKIRSDMSVKKIREVKQQLKEKKSSEKMKPVVEREKDKISARGTRLNVKDEKSSFFILGCEGSITGCTGCHLNCEIRQEACYCVDAPLGNPFPCTVLPVYESIKQDIGESCQFINLELAYHAKGDNSAIPCCKNCEEPCGYQCNRASAWRREREEHKREDSVVATSQLEDAVKDQPVEIVADQSDQQRQPDFPDMKNMQEREDFVNTYKDWKVWCRNELTEEVFYRYDLPDGAAIVVKVFPFIPWGNEKEAEGRRLYLLKPGYKHFADCESNMTSLKEYLKDLKKKK